MVNHLLQSTIFAVACGVLTLAFRANRAHVRHGLWLAASVKFLVPFATLAAVGRQFGRQFLPSVTHRELDVVFNAFASPLSLDVFPVGTRRAFLIASETARQASVATPAWIIGLWIIGGVILTVAWILRWHSVATLARSAMTLEEGREVSILRRLEKDRGLRKPLPLLASDASMEPGVFGLVNPVLLWPQSLSATLDDHQIEAVIAHELTHVKRRDNLLATIHAVVQAAFWFHPIVWWLSARLIDERERACDEDVIDRGSARDVYAETILRICKLSLESPLTCVAGITGADLKRRIEAIMLGEQSRSLSAAQRALLVAVAIVTIGAPVAVGAWTTPRLETRAVRVIHRTEQAPANSTRTFDVASIKANKSGDRDLLMQIQPGGRMNVVNTTLGLLIRNVYRVQDFQVVDAPAWIGSERFDIQAKADGNPTQLELSGMLRNLLTDRFGLVVHEDLREMPIYALVVARGNQQLKRVDRDCGMPSGLPPLPGQAPPCSFRLGSGRIAAEGQTMAALAGALSGRVERIVIDRTGLTGNFDFQIGWSAEPAPPIPGVNGADVSTAAADGPSIFTALQEQLGLRLDAQRGPVKVLVIDSAHLPSVD